MHPDASSNPFEKALTLFAMAFLSVVIANVPYCLQGRAPLTRSILPMAKRHSFHCIPDPPAEPEEVGQEKYPKSKPESPPETHTVTG